MAQVVDKNEIKLKVETKAQTSDTTTTTAAAAAK